jgi:acetyltransferase EpsM
MLPMQPQLNRLMATNFTLYGASGHGKVILDMLQTAGIEVSVMIDDNPKQSELFGVSVLHSSERLPNKEDAVIISIGNNKVRKRLANELSVQFGKAIHPSAIISKQAILGEGTVVMAGVLINPDAQIGKHCIINTGAIIEHDCQIGDFAHISPGAALAGNVTIGEGTHIGIGAAVIQGLKIGKWATIGAGAVIIKDVPDYAVVVGNPGKIIKYNLNDE